MDGIVNKNPVNDAAVKAPRNHSKFDLSYGLAGTMRFGHYQPHFVMEGVADDHIELQSKHTIRSYTMKAPLMQDLNMHKDYFIVYNDAILPRNWDLVFTNPTVGEDVDASKVNTVLPTWNRFLQWLAQILSGADFNLVSESQTAVNPGGFTRFLRWALLQEMIFSAGSLPTLLNSPFHDRYISKDGTIATSSSANAPIANSVAGKTFDDSFDYMLSRITRFVKVMRISNGQNEYKVALGENANDPDALPFRAVLEYFRDDSEWFVESASFYGQDTASFEPDKTKTALSFHVSFNGDYIGEEYDAQSPADTSVPFNYARLCAYQIACAHYYTNDKIDYVYSAELYRQNIYDAWLRYIKLVYTGSAIPDAMSFTLNGLTYEYDNLSGARIDLAIERGYSYLNSSSTTILNAFFDLMRLIFGFNRSLRYVDYFVGAKSRPLAVGDVNIDVTNNKVSAIDVTRNIQRQRFFNAVNRAGRRMSEYLLEIFGKGQNPDYHNPFFLAHTTDHIGTNEVENTGAAQVAADAKNTVTATVMNASERYAFEVDIDRPCILIGITSFDMVRYYPNVRERQTFHVDRYDMFNPFMQTIGDQVVYRDELNGQNSHEEYFGYQLRHMEYKQRVHQAFGGVLNPSTDLDGWFVLADEDIPSTRLWSIGPDYIRSRPFEFDRYYSSLTGHSLGTYFHFIVKIENDCNATRPMIYAPTIL